MLEINKTYTIQDLQKKFNTTRTDNIKRNLTSLGFEYTTQGRGATLKLTITKTPSAFKMFAITELKFNSRTYFECLELYLQLFFLDEGFRQFPISEQVNILKIEYEEDITRQTLSKWRKAIETLGLIHEDGENVKYYSVKAGDKPFELTKEEYQRYWKSFYKVLKSTGSAADAWNEMYMRAGGKCCKISDYEDNAFYNDTIDRLIQILIDSKKERV